MKIHKMENGVEYVLESEMNEADRTAFKQHQILAQCPVPNDLAEGDQAHYAWDWRRWYERNR